MQLQCWVLIGLLTALSCLADHTEVAEAGCRATAPRGSAFVQHSSQVKHWPHHAKSVAAHPSVPAHPPGWSGDECNGKWLYQNCKKSDRAYLNDALGQNPSTKLHAQFSNDAGAELLAEMERQNPDIFTKQAKAREEFEVLRFLDARNVLAFQETWTAEDSRLLESMDRYPEGWTSGKFSQEKFRSYLPSIKVLEDYFGEAPSSIAIVGSGPSLKGHGGMIDNHPMVVRFNNHVGNNLYERDTGRKMTVHVVNRFVEFSGEHSVLHIDLEGTFPGDSMCKRWHNKAAHSSKLHTDELTILLRPSAFCAMGEGLDGFTRGFLFYWLIGRFVSNVDMYGMTDEDGTRHYAKNLFDSAGTVAEPYIAFEHQLYKAAKALHGRKLMAAYNRTEKARAAAAAAALLEANSSTEIDTGGVNVIGAGAETVSTAIDAILALLHTEKSSATHVANASNVSNASTSAGFGSETTTAGLQEAAVNTSATTTTAVATASKRTMEPTPNRSTTTIAAVASERTMAKDLEPTEEPKHGGKTTSSAELQEKGFAAAHQQPTVLAAFVLLQAMWHL